MKKIFCFLVLLLFLMPFSVMAQKAPDGMYDVGGFDLFVDGKGHLGNGHPLVVFETGYADDGDVFDYIQDVVSENAMTISYDRAGLGNSDESPNSRTSVNKAIELHNLIESIGIHKNRDVIFVAHSLGGFTVREYARLYPEDIDGVVLIDTTSEYVLDAVSTYVPFIYDLFVSQFTSPDGSLEEYESSAESIQNIGQTLEDIPTTLIYADTIFGDPAIDSIFSNLVIDEVSGINDVRIYSHENSTHYVFLEYPDFVIEKINEMIDIVKWD
jgi:pimeloyl-ACP methyl ester carboxylesterase